MARNERDESGRTEVVLMVCVKCGREVQFEGGEEPPSDMTCEKCGNQVFRRFDDVAPPDEAQADFRDTTERDMNTNDPPSDTEEGDILDLNNP
ncbi:MAG: hypothetical protein ACOCVZ_01585 [Gemmatimonadota bacterium]